MFRDPSSSSNGNTSVQQSDSVNSNLDGIEPNDEVPLAQIRPNIHSKTKNWYSGYCNRWASLIGVSLLKTNNFIVCYQLI